MNELSWVIDWIHSRSSQRLIVGIDGFGGSGKSTLADRIRQSVMHSEVIAFDDLYLPEQIRPDFLSSPVGIADAYDWEALRDCVLARFREGARCEYPVLNWETQERASRALSASTRVLIIEGVSCTRPEVRSLYDFRIWVKTPYDIRLARGVGRDGEGMRRHWTDVWMPSEEIYFESCQPVQEANLVVDGTS